MDNIFGLSMTTILIVTLGIMALCLLTTVIIALRNRVIFKMAIRNIPRRKAQTVLIMVGLMLSTLIIAASLTTGDTLDHSIKSASYNGLGEVDETIAFVGDAGGEGSISVNNIPIQTSIVDELETRLGDNPDIEGIMPILTIGVPVVNMQARLSEPEVIMTGVDPARLDAFGGLKTPDGGTIDFADLPDGSVVISEDLAENTNTNIGDTITFYYQNQPHEVTVGGIAEGSLLTGFDSSLGETSDLLGISVPISFVQELTGLEGQARYIAISNRGGIEGGEKLTDAVEPELRAALDTIDGGDELGVNPVKQDAIKGAALFGAVFMSFFLVMGLFSVAAGVLLIFLIFMMLAAERRSEMGMARAVGMKRSHLVQGFIAEGTAYDLGAALLGAAAGVLVAFAIAGIMANLIGDFISITPHATFRSLAVAYALGVTVTFLTIIFASVRSSRLNIVAAIRDLPDNAAPGRHDRPRWRWWTKLPRFGPRIPGLNVRWISLPWAVFEFIWNVVLVLLKAFLWELRVGAHYLGWGIWLAALGAFFMLSGSSGYFNLLLYALGFALYAAIGIWLYRVIRGTRPIVIKILSGAGLALVAVAVVGSILQYASLDANDRAFNFAYSLFRFSLGLTLFAGGLAILLSRYLPKRPVYTVAAALMLVFWLSPEGSLDFILPELGSGDFEMFFVSGLSMVTFATLIIMWNSEILIGAVSIAGRYFSRWLPAVKTAVAYPLASKGRTGMTVAMFSMVIFSLVTLTTINSNFIELFSTEEADAGWDVRVDANASNPIEDAQARLAAGGVDVNRIDAIGRVESITYGNAQVRNSGEDEWKNNEVSGLDAAYIENAEVPLEARAPGYASDDAVWDAFLAGEDVAIVDSFVFDGGGFGSDPDGYFAPDEVEIVDGSIPAFTIEVEDASSGEMRTLTVIGVIDSNVSTLFGIFMPQQAFDAIYGGPDKVNLLLRLENHPASDAESFAKDVEAALLTSGAQAESIQAEIDEENAVSTGFFRLLQGFMGLGLLVGIAALGVISFRSVVERRQQIGMLRAIGYQRNMVALSFVFESLVVAILGVVSGTVLALVLSYNLINSGDIQEGADFSGFVIPWGTVLFFVGASLVAAVLMTWVPARTASSVPIAEALRYE